jgi:translation initiation factor 1
MTAKEPLDSRPPDGALKHNPFAALRGQVREVPAAADAEQDAAPAPESARRSTEYPGRVTVRRERSGRGGKTVTVAEGPGLAGHDLAKLAREAASALGLGARVESGGLVLQGEQSERLAAWLSARGFTQVVRGN